MRSVLLRSLTVIAIGGIVLAGVLYVASTVDARPPTVLEMRLTQAVGEDSQLALITTSLEVVFSEPIDPDSAAQRKPSAVIAIDGNHKSEMMNVNGTVLRKFLAVACTGSLTPRPRIE